MTAEELKIARWLAAAWVLGANEEETATVPLVPSVLDTALKALVERPGFPAWAKQQLHFATNLAGIRCRELSGILHAAQEAGLAEVPNPTYRVLQFTFDKAFAKQLLERVGEKDFEAAAQLGSFMRQAVDERKAALASASSV